MYTIAELLRPCESNTRERNTCAPTLAPERKKRARIHQPNTYVPTKGQSTSTHKHGRNISFQALKIAHILGISPEYAQFMYETLGNDRIYAPSDTTRPNTHEWRITLAHVYGRVAVVDKNGDVWKYTWDNLDNRLHKELMREVAKAKAEYDAVIKDYRQRKRDELFFESQQTKPCPKRQGRGNSHADFGKYKNSRAVTFNEFCNLN